MASKKPISSAASPSKKPRSHKTLSDSARAVRNRTLWESYNALPSQTRLKISLLLCATGIAGIIASDYLEKRKPAEPVAPVASE
ncbi:hypothetical protein HGRIS_008301 [Hohenbuehelia grisea]|uniref:Uncharacterized protein n=1 Tax=Hohenbuehelia grisea TaxID=104357 RepID=A0ABR3J7J1_9AGAR